MKDAAQLQAIMDVLAEINKGQGPADSIIAAYFRGHRYIGSKDRAKIAAALYDILRHYYRFNWWAEYLLGNVEGYSAPRLAVMLYLALIKKEKVEAICAHFSGGKYAPAPLDEAEHTFLKKLEGRTLLHPDMDAATRLECPAEAYEKLTAQYGQSVAEELQAMQEPALLDIRVNTLKAGRDTVLAALHEENIKAVATPFSPFGIRIEGRPPLSQMALFKEGHIEIQDEGSQLIALLLDASAGMNVVDFCAGAGGKTLAIAAMMNNKGRVTACDVFEKRLERARLRFRRAGVHNIETETLKNEQDAWVKRHAGKFDRVLVDAPCSGTGTWRRNPDARWKQLGPKLDELTALQASILHSAARLLKAGGRLVYATCSLLAEENERQIETFLKSHPDFKCIPAQACLGEIGSTPLLSGDYLSLTPARHKTDGFFAAALQKN